MRSVWAIPSPFPRRTCSAWAICWTKWSSISRRDEQVEDEDEEHTIQIAVVGRPNVGKSSLVNRILGQERSMVSGIAGTTRDAIDTAFRRATASATTSSTPQASAASAPSRRNPSSVTASCARWPPSAAATWRSSSSMREDGVTEQDTKVAGYVHDEGKAAVIVVNKWDALEKDTNTHGEPSARRSSRILNSWTMRRCSSSPR